MKSFLRTVALASVLTILAAAPLASTAKAEFVNYDREVMRSAQIRLSQLGYNVAYSGLGDNMTASALMDFQRLNGLPVTGLLTDSTYNLLFQAPTYTAAYYPSYSYIAAPAYTYYPTTYYSAYGKTATYTMPVAGYAAPAMPVAGYGAYATPVAGYAAYAAPLVYSYR